MQAKFFNWPSEGNYKPWTVVVTLILVIVAYLGVGQIPITLAILSEIELSELQGISQREIAEVLGQNYYLTLLLIPFLAIVGMLYLAIRKIHQTRFLHFLTARSRFDVKRFFTAFTIWGGLQLVIHFALIWSGQPIQWNYQGFEFWNLLFISLFILPLQSSAEELIFRSYLFKAFNRLDYPLARVLLTGLLFGLMHGLNPEVEQLGDIALVYYIYTGIFLGLITYLDNGLELALGYHAINNIFASVVVTNDWQVFQTPALWIDNRPPEFGWELIMSLLLLQPLMFFVFSKLYRWDLRKIFSKV